MDLFNNLALGFGVAFTSQNLMYAFIGCLLMLRKQLDRQSQSLEFVGMSPLIRGIFRRNGFSYLFTAPA